MARFLGILFVVYFAHTNGNTFHYPDHVFDRTALGDDIDKASMRLLLEEYNLAGDKNVVSSPLGVFTLLALYAKGAEGPVRDEIMRVLGARNYSQILNSYGQLADRFSKMDPDFLTVANKIYVSNEHLLNEDFKNTAVHSFGSDVESIDFKNPEKASATINQWATEKTKHHINNPVPVDAIDADIVSALFNVIFFKGHWNVPFKVKDTKEEDFHVDRSTVVKKPTMHLIEALFYYDSQELEAQLIELPYKEKNFRMVLVLPNEVDGLPSLLEKVSHTGVLREVFSLEPLQVDADLYVPKFSIESEFDLNKILPKFGISKIFKEGAYGILKDHPVKVSKAFQKAFVKVDEEGATAGAFTGGFVHLLIAAPEPKPIEIRVDHQFMFLILHEDKILFAGTYVH